MLGNGSSNQENIHTDTTTKTNDLALDTCTTADMCIPKVEPCYSSCNSNEEVTNYDREMELCIPFTAPYKVRDPYIVLERCDKIWETIKLIKDVQKDTNTAVTNYKTNMETTNTEANVDAKTTQLTKPTQTYMKYEPVLGNNNVALPNFQFSLKAAKKLYGCPMCNKQYSEIRGLRLHSRKIHGIEMPVMHRKRSVLSVEDKDIQQQVSEVVGKGKESNRKPDTKKSEKDQNKDNWIAASLRNQTDEQNLNVQKKNSLISNDTSNVNIKTKDTLLQKDSSKKQKISCTSVPNVQQKERRHDRSTCMLCRQRVRHLKRHLTDYHKIGCADTMIKEFRETLTNNTKHKKNVKDAQKTVNNNSEVAKEELRSRNQESLPPLQSKHINQPNFGQKGKKRKTTSLPSEGTRKRQKTDENNTTESQKITKSLIFNPTMEKDKYICDICLGVYVHPTSFRSHLRCHFIRGETKENFHLFECKYINSPLFRKQKGPLNITDSTQNKVNKDISTITEGGAVSKDTSNFLQSHRRQIEDLEITCSCGRQFRDPYTLFVHKRKCKIQTSAKEQNANMNSVDRDSGCGINITIKKKNNSYEVVGSSFGNKDKPVDSPKQSPNCKKECDAVSDTSDYISEDCSNIQDANQPFEMSAISKYSKYHTILKLKIADEDVDVDIEDLHGTSLGKTVNSSSCESNRKDRLPKKDVKQKEIPTLRSMCKKVISKHKLRRSVSKKGKKNEKQWTKCICGEKFKNHKTFIDHMHTSHALLLSCPYCKDKFDHYDKFTKHMCTVESGETFIEKKHTPICQYCSISLPNLAQFDKHITLSHPNTMLPLHCHKCSERFVSHSMRQQHLRSVHSRVVCSICYKRHYYTVEAEHNAYHFGLGFPCHVCKRSYPSKALMEIHTMLQHSN